MKRKELFFGILMFIGFVAYYLLMRFTGLYTNTYLRVFNFVIQFAATHAMFKYFFNPDTHLNNSSKALLSGVKASLWGVSMFVAFMVIYLAVIEPPFLMALQNQSPLGEYLTPASAAVLLFTEGMLAGSVSTFISQRIIKSRYFHQQKVNDLYEASV